MSAIVRADGQSSTTVNLLNRDLQPQDVTLHMGYIAIIPGPGLFMLSTHFLHYSRETIHCTTTCHQLLTYYITSDYIFTSLNIEVCNEYHWLLPVTVATEVLHVPALPAHSTWPPTQHTEVMYILEQGLTNAHPTSVVGSMNGFHQIWGIGTSVKGMYMHMKTLCIGP